MIGLAERFEIVMAPRVFFVTTPGVKKFRANLRRELFLAHARLQVRGWQRGNDQKKYYSSAHVCTILAACE